MSATLIGNEMSEELMMQAKDGLNASNTKREIPHHLKDTHLTPFSEIVHLEKNQTLLVYAQSLGVNGYSQEDVELLKEIAHEQARSRRPKPEVKLDDIMGETTQSEKGEKVKPCPKQCEENKKMVKIVFDLVQKEKDALTQKMNNLFADKEDAEVLFNEMEVESNILQQRNSDLKDQLDFMEQTESQQLGIIAGGAKMKGELDQELFLKESELNQLKRELADVEKRLIELSWSSGPSFKPIKFKRLGDDIPVFDPIPPLQFESKSKSSNKTRFKNEKKQQQDGNQDINNNQQGSRPSTEGSNASSNSEVSTIEHPKNVFFTVSDNDEEEMGEKYCSLAKVYTPDVTDLHLRPMTRDMAHYHFNRQLHQYKNDVSRDQYAAKMELWLRSSVNDRKPVPTSTKEERPSSTTSMYGRISGKKYLPSLKSHKLHKLSVTPVINEFDNTFSVFDTANTNNYWYNFNNSSRQKDGKVFLRKGGNYNTLPQEPPKPHVVLPGHQFRFSKSRVGTRNKIKYEPPSKKLSMLALVKEEMGTKKVGDVTSMA